KDHLTLNFLNIPLRSALNIITNSAGVNSVVSDSVKGTISLHLKDIPWTEALDIVLKTKGLGKLYLGQVLLIAPNDEIAAREKASLELQLQVQELEPLQTTVIVLNYAKADDLVSILKDKTNSLLSDRGSVTVDKRTNALLLKDTPEMLSKVRTLIEKLDAPVKQVLIEARIVEVARDFERTLGIRWGISKADHLSGTLEGASGIQQNLAMGKSAFDTTNVSPLSRLNVNLPAQPSSGQAASVGIALANLGNGYLLDLELSALESEGQGELISSPRLVTADQQEAFIEAGEEIPYQETASSGNTTVAFKQATLKLDVTPHITPDNNIIMAIKVNQDKPSTALEVQGTPAITTRKIDTKVRVANGETVVLGGIYRQEKTHSVLRVPFWGGIPIVGALFRSTKVTDSRGELLIFITPKIVQPDNSDTMIE
ncbi:MAG: Type pilus biosis protein PilQ, partial [Gammaproteobacteria bacterium]|nr:Type pilus biosis protein PilQ [Gammaproteobacteria bacterium]